MVKLAAAVWIVIGVIFLFKMRRVDKICDEIQYLLEEEEDDEQA